MFFRNGYVVRRKGRKNSGCFSKEDLSYEDYFRVKPRTTKKYHNKKEIISRSGYLSMQIIIFPKEFVGKKVRLKVEKVEE